MTPDLVERIGAALYGPAFKTQLAMALSVNPTTVYHWCNGRETPPPSIRGELADLLRQRGRDVADLLNELTTESRDG